MKLYYWPGTCGITIHILLEELGLRYDRETVDLSAKHQYSRAYLAINPKGKVPALVRDDGSVLTEVPAIAMWLASVWPAGRLLPDDVEGRTRAFELLSYIAATTHMQGAARAWRPLLFSASPDEQEAVVARGREIVMQGMDIFSQTLGRSDWLLGDYSAADASLFFIEYWAVEKVHYTLPPNIDAHYRRMRARPAVQRALAAEGLT
ncbi:MAG: glutathione S-transferase family protein [Beijerinckiaceae bacterium]